MPESMIVTLFFGFPCSDATFLFIKSTIYFPYTTLPKTVCFPSNQLQGTKVIKNWEPFVFFPAFAIDNKYGSLCFIMKF